MKETSRKFLKKIFFPILILILSFSNYHSQELKNNLEVGVLGNLGFFHVGYTRSIHSFDQSAINFGFKVGYVPASGDKMSTNLQNSVPNFIHLNFPVEFLWKFHPSNNLGIGASYSKIIVASDKNNARPETNYNRTLGEVSYAHKLNFNNDSEAAGWIKVSFTPIIYDNHADDVSDIPVRLSFIYNF